MRSIYGCRQVKCSTPDNDLPSWNLGAASMTACGDQEESKSPITLFCASPITPKSTLRVGCLNIRTLFQVGKTVNVMKEFRKYRQGMRWTGFGKMRTNTGEYILYSGSEEDYQRGVGLVLKKEARMALLRWNPLSGRIMIPDSILDMQS